jgi:hypothetical protein
MIYVAHADESVASLLDTIPQWLKSRDDVGLLFTAIHESIHVVYARDLGYSPEIYGPEFHYHPGLGWRQANATVGGLPRSIMMNGDPILVGKHYLGPGHFISMLGGNLEQEEIWKDGPWRWEWQGDLSIYNEWCVKRHHEKRDLHEQLSYKICESVYADYQSFWFHQKVWAIAREYAVGIETPRS